MIRGCESACKPDSVPSHLGGGHLSGTGVAAGLERPTWDVVGGSPMSLLGLAPGGVCRAVPVTRDAGGLLHHRCTLACARRPSAVCSLWHFPSDRSAWTLSSTLPCGVRTFLRSKPAAARRTHESSVHNLWCRGGRESGESEQSVGGPRLEQGRLDVLFQAGDPTRRELPMTAAIHDHAHIVTAGDVFTVW